MKFRTVHDVILSPVVSEKSYTEMDDGKYRFKVHSEANKIQIRKAIEAMFEGVKVDKVNTQKVRGKTRRRGRVTGRLPNWKKATVTLAEGDIDLFDRA